MGGFGRPFLEWTSGMGFVGRCEEGLKSAFVMGS